MAKLKPDIAVVDIALGGGNGVELVKDMKVRHPKLPALDVVNARRSAVCRTQSARRREGYVMKQEEPEVLLRAIRQVLRGQNLS